LSLLPFFFFAVGYTNDTRIYRGDALHIGLRMANFKLLIVALAAACSGMAHAGYAQVSPPSGWSVVNNQFVYRAAANDVSFVNGVRGAASGVINVGGRAVTMPAAYRFAANAGQFVARAAFINPLWFVAAGVAYGAYSYFQSGGFEVVDGVWNQKTGGIECLSGCFTYSSTDGRGTSTGELYSKQKVADAVLALTCTYSSVCGLGAHVVWVNPDVFSITYSQYGSVYEYFRRSIVSKSTPPYNTVKYSPVPQEQFESTMGGLPFPNGFPQKWPTPLPVELPILNPSADPVPVPQPLRAPQGEPQLVPNSNPQQWKTPVVDLVPSPTVDNPWRVDVQPKDIVKTDASPLPDTAPVPVTPPAGETPVEKTPDLCEKNPDILACAKPDFDTPDSDPLDTKDKPISIAPDTGWGSDNAACPAPRHLAFSNVEFTFTTYCDFMSGIRPVVIAAAWLAAAFILLGFKGSSE
jgi:hypothetical protein